jgi:nucleotidyltransferase/DNA polymerase involved in DNA repair
MKPVYACVYAREFPAQALSRLRPEVRAQACAVMEGEAPLERVCSANAKARRLGVEHGMTRVEIDTVPGVTVLARSVAEEASARAALLECAGRFSPRVEELAQESCFVCVVDIAGTETLFGRPERLAKKLLAEVETLGVAACVAVSGNFHAAVSLAQGMQGARRVLAVAEGQVGAALAPLPLGVLGLSPAQTETFMQWGIGTLGQLAALPETALISRLGQPGKRARLLARGELPHLFLPIEPQFALLERLEFESPVEVLDSLLFVVSTMLEQLALRANARALALATVSVTLALEGGAAMDQADPSGYGGASTGRGDPCVGADGHTGCDQHGADGVVLTPDAGGCTSGCNVGPHSRHRRRGCRWAGSAGRYASQRCLPYGGISYCNECACWEAISSRTAWDEAGRKSSSNATASSGGEHHRDSAGWAAGDFFLSRDAVCRRTCLRSLAGQRYVVEPCALEARAVGHCGAGR